MKLHNWLDKEKICYIGPFRKKYMLGDCKIPKRLSAIALLKDFNRALIFTGRAMTVEEEKEMIELLNVFNYNLDPPRYQIYHWNGNKLTKKDKSNA